MTFRIAQISDTHLSESKPFFVDNFVRIGEALRSAKPDLVLNTGDITLDGASQESDLAAARLLHDALGLPVRFIPGNHDLGDSPYGPSPGEHTIDAVRRARYLKHFGPDWWSFDIPGWRILGINAQLLGSDLPEAAEQESAVAHAMEGLGLRSLALFLHRPMFDKSPDETEIGGRFVHPEPRQRLLAAFGAVVPALVVCGHVHQYRESWSGSTRHVWGTSTGYVIPDRRQPRYGLKEVGYVEHTLRPDGTHRSELVRVPGVETLNIENFPGAYGPV
ncbi:MAG: metallophosphoesterase [Reyranella sp.]|uniref:metallophosphoesterase family protein n=1 Tax=Reyranella sp. TaxID=1929291 RepID=UPI001AC8F99B|nr:metallophosphoesterase [Reyranella sp.]MBN9088372.1 metallophosphoesterase [Reyranella sp.]